MSIEIKRRMNDDSSTLARHVEPRLAFKLQIESAEPLEPSALYSIRVSAVALTSIEPWEMSASLDSSGTKLTLSIPTLMGASAPKMAKICVVSGAMKTRSGKLAAPLKLRIARLVGDANLDGMNNVGDQIKLGQGFSGTTAQIRAGWVHAHLASPEDAEGALQRSEVFDYSTADINLDGVVDSADLTELLSNSYQTEGIDALLEWPEECRN